MYVDVRNQMTKAVMLFILINASVLPCRLLLYPATTVAIAGKPQHPSSNSYTKAKTHDAGSQTTLSLCHPTRLLITNKY